MPTPPTPAAPARSPARSQVSQRKDPELPPIEPIANDFIELNIGHYFGKSYSDIQKAVDELPHIMEYINECLQRAHISSMKAKWDMEAFEAETYTRLRQGWASMFAEKMTETALTMVVNQDKDLQTVRNNYAVTKSYVSRLANMQENLRIKLDAQRSVEATRRRMIDDEPAEDR